MSEKRIGVLITHGTDTMAWTLAYLKYAVKGFPHSIAVTGAQLPISPEFPYSDGYENLKASLIYLMRLKTPSIFAVFNVGQYAYSDSLLKVNKWANDAFIGDPMLRMEWNEIKHNLQHVELYPDDEPLDKLFLVTTGGTISSQKNEAGVLEPRMDTVSSFIYGHLGDYFRKNIRAIPVFSIDSSDMTLQKQHVMARAMATAINEDMGGELMRIDLSFSDRVRIIYLDPIKTVAECRREGENADGVVLAGFGGGNVSLDMLDLIREWTAAGKPVVLSSQVPIGIADSEYNNGYEPLRAGAVSGVDLSLVECQVRLSYILGHQDMLPAGEEGMRLIKTLFLSGVKFRTRQSESRHLGITKIAASPNDWLVNYDFIDSVQKTKLAIKSTHAEEQ